MATRYENTNITTKDGKRVFETTIYAPIEAKEDDIYILSQNGDRLDLLAKRFYNDVTKWWVIAQANNIGKGTLDIEPGLQIRIPADLNAVQNDLKNLQQSR